MKFTEIPNNHQCFRCPLVYSFDTEGESADVDVQIIDADTLEVLGIKRLYNLTTGSIDISPYLCDNVRPTLPAKVEGCGEVDCSMQVNVKVVVGGVESEVRRYIAAHIDYTKPYVPLMNNISKRVMACDEFDIISWYSSPEAEVGVVVESFGKGTETLEIHPGGVGQQAVAITALDFSNDPDTMSVSLLIGDDVVTVVEYEIKPNLRGARRLAWLNEHLAPELYTFPLRKSVLVKATRKHIEKLYGTEAAALERKNELKLISAYEPMAQLKAFADILPSERLWLVEGCVPQRVEIVVDRSHCLPCDEMLMFEVNLRAAVEGVNLW